MNEYFQVGSVPAPNSPGASSVVRQEFTNIASGFDKLPVMAGHAGEIITVNGTGTGLVASGIIAGSFATLPGVETLTNKTMNWAANTFVGFSQGLGIDLKAPINSPAFTGAPSAPTPPTGDASSRLATTFFVTNTVAAIGAVTPGNNLPLMDGVAAPGVDPALVSRQDHVHPSDTSRAPASAATAAGTTFTPVGTIAATDVQLALQELDTEKAPLASPGFTGTPTAPTVVDSNDTTTKIATTAWVQTRLSTIPVSVQLSDSNPIQAGVSAAPGVGVEASRYDHVHLRQTAAQTQNTPAGGIVATDVQAALNELDSEKQPLIGTISGLAKGNGANALTAASAGTDYLAPAAIGVTVQAYDADTAKTDVAQNFTLPQRSALLVDNDGNFDLSAKQNFKCTTAAGLTLTFTNQADGLSGSVVFINASNHAIAAHANTKLTTSDLTKLSATGTYRIDYMTDGTNALCSVVGPYA